VGLAGGTCALPYAGPGGALVLSPHRVHRPVVLDPPDPAPAGPGPPHVRRDWNPVVAEVDLEAADRDHLVRVRDGERAKHFFQDGGGIAIHENTLPGGRVTLHPGRKIVQREQGLSSPCLPLGGY